MSEGWAALARARSLMEIRRFADARETLSSALSDPETAAEANCLVAQSFVGQGKYRDALKAAGRASSMEPNEEWAHRLRAIGHQGLGQHKKALTAAQEAARLAPSSLPALNVLAMSQINCGKRKLAVQTAETGLSAHPHAALAHETAGVVAMANRDWKGAEEHLRESMRTNPNDADVAQHLAAVLKKLGRKQEAAETLLAAARADPTRTGTRHALGRLGLPVAAFGGVSIFKIVLASQSVRLLRNVQPAAGVVIVGAFFVLVGGWLSIARFRGTRILPDHIHQGLMADHRNYALSWLAWAGWVALPLAVWAAGAPYGHGQSASLAWGLVAFCFMAQVINRRFWVGEHPSRARWAAWRRRLLRRS
jgi:tetratricopeptide (TPR) repeat protein